MATRRSQCIVLRHRHHRKPQILVCSSDRKRLTDALNACYASAHPTLEDCDVVADDVPILRGLAGAKLRRATRSGSSREARFDNGWRVETWWDRRSRNWLTQTFDADNSEVDVDYSGSAKDAAANHQDAIAAVERWASPHIDAAEFRAKRGGSELAPIIAVGPFGRPRLRRRRKR